MIAQIRSAVLCWYSIPLLLVIWFAAVESGLTQSRLLPNPARVFSELAAEIGNGTLVYHAYVTLSRELTGFLRCDDVIRDCRHGGGRLGGGPKSAKRPRMRPVAWLQPLAIRRRKPKPRRALPQPTAVALVTFRHALRRTRQQTR